MANFRSKDVLTVSATIIAGLLILLTLQGLSTSPILAKIAEIQDELDTKNIELGAIIIAKSNLESKLSQTNNEEEKIYIQNKIIDLQVQGLQLQTEIDGITNKQSQWVSQSNQLKIAQNIQVLRLTVLAMTIPFALAIVSEASAALKPQHNANELATSKGKNLLIYGCLILVLGLAIIVSSAWF